MTTPTQVSTILSVMADIATAFAGQVSQWVTTIFTAGNEILVFAIAVPLATVGIALLVRLLNQAHV